MSTLLYIILSTFIISLGSLIGIFTLSIKDKSLEKVLLSFVSLSAGALIGGAFLHLIPKALSKSKELNVFIILLVGFTSFFFIEKLLHWRHCHSNKCEVHTFSQMNLIGDGIHNFIDGLIIAASFVADTRLGVATSFAVAFHEIPQEIGDYGVLVYGGYKKYRALFLNLVCALTAVIGGIIGFFLSSHSKLALSFLLPFAAGGFIYIAASDLIPEMRKEKSLKRSMIHFSVFLLGIIIIYLFKFLGAD
jgi:zinc and cadmium transporter